jgi:hypothetical protein
MWILIVTCVTSMGAFTSTGWQKYAVSGLPSHAACDRAANDIKASEDHALFSWRCIEVRP